MRIVRLAKESAKALLTHKLRAFFMMAGTLMLAGVIFIIQHRRIGWHLLAAGWGVIFGLAYGSFFSKLYTDNPHDPGNIPFRSLLWIVGTGLVAAALGLIWCLCSGGHEHYAGDRNQFVGPTR